MRGQGIEVVSAGLLGRAELSTATGRVHELSTSCSLFELDALVVLDFAHVQVVGAEVVRGARVLL